MLKLSQMQNLFEGERKGDSMSYYVHDVPGRLRVKTPSVKGNPVKALQVEGLLSGKKGVLSVASNQTTGSVVINYDTSVASKKEILEVLREGGHFDPSKAITNEQVIEDSFSKGGKWLSKAILGLVVDRVFEGTPLSLLAVIL
jgi:copper chaperone CopZ